MANDEQLNLIVTQQGAQEAANQLKQLAAAQGQVTAATKAQDQAARAMQTDLNNLRKSVLEAADAYDEMADSADRAGKSSKEASKGGDVVRVTGAAGRALGAISPGAGSALRDIQDIQEFGKSLGDISKTAVAAGVGIGAATLALSLLQAQAQKVKEAAQAELTQREQIIAFIQTATKEELDAKVKQLQDARRINQITADDANAQLKAIRDAIKQQFGDAGLAIAEFNAKIGTGAPELAAAIANADEYNKKLGETDTALAIATQAQQAGVTATNDATKAEIELTAARQQATERGIKYLLDETKFQQDAAKFSEDQNRQRQADIQNQIALVTQEIELRQKSGDTTKENIARLDELAIQFAQLSTQESYLASTGLDLAKANDARIASEKYAAKQTQELADATQKYNDDIAAWNEKDAASREKLRDALIGIVEEAQKAAEKAYADLLQKQAELSRDLANENDKAARDAQREQIQTQLDGYRAEIDAYKNYKRKLRDIDLKVQDDAFALALNRDFSGLFNQQRDVSIAKRDAALAERDSIEDSRESTARKLADQKAADEAERQERLIAFQQRIADTIAAYQQERVQIDANRRDQEAKAQAQRVKEKAVLDAQYSARLTAAQNELNLISQTEQQRYTIIANTQNALLAQARSMLAAVQGGSTGAGGNSFALSQQFNITSGADANGVKNIVKTETVNAVKKLIGQ